MLYSRAHLAHRSWRGPCLALVVALSGTQVSAQQSPPSAASPAAATVPVAFSPSPDNQPRTAPTISTAADEVSLDLVVRTKRGKPILDLKPSDLAVTDNGSPVSLSELHLVNGVSQSQRLISLVFDRLDPGPAKTAREIADKILKAIPDKGYSYAVLQMNGRLRILQSWTEQHEQVEQAIAEAIARNQTASAEFTPAEKQVLAAAQDESLSADFADRTRARLLLSALEDSQRILEDQHAYPSLSALMALARAQRQITGRKLIIYFSEGLNADSDARDTIRSLVGQANRAGVTICAIDTVAMSEQVGDQMMGAMAMASQGPGAAIGAANSLGASGYGRGATNTTPIGQVMDAAENMSTFEFNSMEEVQSPLTRLAAGTGGIYIRAGASLKRPIQQLHEDLTTYYEAAYVPTIKDYNGAFRPIVIRPLRKGILVTSRSGYFAIPPENGSGIRPFEVPLLNILNAETLPTDLSFRASVLHLGQLPDGNTGDLTVEVPISSLQIHDDGNTHMSSVHATIVSEIKNDKGAVVQRFSEDIPRHEAPDLLHKGDDNVLTMQRHFTADPGTYTLETAVLDRFTNKAGAQRTTFTIAPVSHGPALSDLTLVRQVEPLHTETAAFEPMRYRNGRILPDLAAELPENTRGFSVFFIVHPATGAAQPQLTMQIARNGETLAKMPLELSKPSGVGNAIPYLGTVQGRAFPPGDYKVTALLTQGGQTASSSTSFKVEGTIAASMAPASSFSVAGSSGSDRAADESLVAAAATVNSQFAISSPTNPLPPPSAAEIHDMIEGARQRALAWSETLPNFLCIEITDHSIDPGGRGDWRHKDTMVELMRYLEHQESRTMIQLNGERSSIEPADLDFAHSIGEFGGMFQVVFDPSAKAQFAWKEADVLDGQPVQVFTFKVARANSNFSLTGLNNRQLAIGFHGQLFLDPSTRSIRRLTLDADDIPENLTVRATSISVDYAWVAIANHDYLMPVRGAVSLREGRHQAVLNEFEFRNYRRFASQVRILTKEEAKKLSPN